MAGVHYRDIVDSALDGDPDLIAAIERLLSGKGLEFRGVIPVGPIADGRHADVRVSGLENARFRVILCWRLREPAAALAGGAGEPERLLLAREDERRRVARELHDSVEQDLAAIDSGFTTSIARNRANCPPAAVSELQGLINQTQIDVRTSTFLMHPPELGDGDLSAALGRMIIGLRRRTSLKVDLHPARGGSKIPPALARSLYRIAQEGMINIHRPRQGDARQPAPDPRPALCHPRPRGQWHRLRSDRRQRRRHRPRHPEHDCPRRRAGRQSLDRAPRPRHLVSGSGCPSSTARNLHSPLSCLSPQAMGMNRWGVPRTPQPRPGDAATCSWRRRVGKTSGSWLRPRACPAEEKSRETGKSPISLRRLRLHSGHELRSSGVMIDPVATFVTARRLQVKGRGPSPGGPFSLFWRVSLPSPEKWMAQS